MAIQSLLGHIAFRFSSHPENIATESLAYILGRSPAAKRSLLGYVQNLGLKIPDAVVFHPQTSGPDGSIPDLVGTDPDGKDLVILEAKFWAGLTENQPVSYLNRLPLDKPAALVFVAPALRITILWAELLLRCKEANIELGSERQVSSDMKCCTVRDHHVLALTSWQALLTQLLYSLNAEGDLPALSDVLQLQGLCDRMDDNAFLPLQSEELTSTTASRLIQFFRLVDDVVDWAVRENLASVSGLRTSGSGGAYVRPMMLCGYGCQLSVNPEHWAHRRSTPIWLSISDREWKLTQAVMEVLAPLEHEDPPRIIHSENLLLVPLRLPIGVERPVVVESLFAQVREIAGFLTRSGAKNRGDA